MKKISVVGAGSWGTTLAVLLGEKGFDVKLWARRKELANEIESRKENLQYLPGIKIPSNVITNHSLKNAINDSEIIIIAVPSEFLRKTINEIKPYFNNQILVSVTKGIEHNTCRRMSPSSSSKFSQSLFLTASQTSFDSSLRYLSRDLWV